MFNKKRDVKSVTQDILLLKRKITDFEGTINDMEAQIIKIRQDKLTSGGKADDKLLQDELRENRLNLRAASAKIDELESELVTLLTEEVTKERAAATATLEKLIADTEAAGKTFYAELGKLEAYRQLNLPNSTKGLGQYLVAVAGSEDILIFSAAEDRFKKDQNEKKSLAQEFTEAQNRVRYFNETAVEEIVQIMALKLLQGEM